MLATLQDNGTVLVRITPDHPRYEALRAQAGAGEADGFEAVLGPEHPRHAAIVQYLRGLKPDRYAYDPNEARDKAGKWTHGERANALHEKRQALKQARKDTYKEIDAEARPIREHLQAQYGQIRTAYEGLIDPDELDGDLPSIDEYSLMDQRSMLRGAIETASERLASMPPPIALTEQQLAAKRQMAQNDRDITAAHRQMEALITPRDDLRHKIALCEMKGDKENIEKYAAELQAYREKTQPLLEPIFAAMDRLKKQREALLPQMLQEGLDQEEHARDQGHLHAIVAASKAALPILKQYMRLRREMTAIRRGEPVETKDTPPGRLFNRRGRPRRYQNKALRRSILDAAAQTDTSPSEDQKKAGNYRKGHVMLHGLDISIENPAGSRRSGKDKDGTTWSVKMAHHYGYIKCTESEADGDSIDVFIGPEPESEIVFIIDQVDRDWQFDEHKILIGWTNAAEAKAGYLACYSPGWWGFGSITPMTMDAFKEWIEEGDTGKEVADLDA